MINHIIRHEHSAVVVHVFCFALPYSFKSNWKRTNQKRKYYVQCGARKKNTERERKSNLIDNFPIIMRVQRCKMFLMLAHKKENITKQITISFSRTPHNITRSTSIGTIECVIIIIHTYNKPTFAIIVIANNIASSLNNTIYSASLYLTKVIGKSKLRMPREYHLHSFVQEQISTHL